MNPKYHDTMARRALRRRLFAWGAWFLVGVVALAGIGGLVWSRGRQQAAIQPEPVRVPRGVWCKKDAAACQFWDESGARWGETALSIGPLLLLVRDERSQENGEAKLLSGILAAVDGIASLGLQARAVTLPDAEPGGTRITLMNGYDLLMDAHGDIPDQLSTLAVFLADRAKDSAFRPTYIDLRTPGRIYYQ